MGVNSYSQSSTYLPCLRSLSSCVLQPRIVNSRRMGPAARGAGPPSGQPACQCPTMVGLRSKATLSHPTLTASHGSPPPSNRQRMPRQSQVTSERARSGVVICEFPRRHRDVFKPRLCLTALNVRKDAIQVVVESSAQAMANGFDFSSRIRNGHRSPKVVRACKSQPIRFPRPGTRRRSDAASTGSLYA